MAKILVIDDDGGTRRNVLRMLSRAEHEVAAARDGVEGLEIFRRTRPDLVITDIVMPEKEGIETIRGLRREQPLVPILAISGSIPNARSYLDFATLLGADAALIKPFRVDDLLHEIDGLLVTTSARPVK